MNAGLDAEINKFVCLFIFFIVMERRPSQYSKALLGEQLLK